MFVRNGIAEHLARGVAGIGALAACMFLAPSHPWLSIAVLPVSFVAIRGCPACWTMGLVQKVIASVQGKWGGNCVVRRAHENGFRGLRRIEFFRYDGQGGVPALPANATGSRSGTRHRAPA
jgi:hypothetical protein